MNGEVSVVFNRNCFFSKMKDYSRLRPLKGSHVHRKCGSVKEMMQDRRESYGLSNCAISNDFG